MVISFRSVQDSNSPAYQNAEYLAMEQDLAFLQDMWDCDRIHLYLPKDRFETNDSYEGRLSRAYWQTPFKRSIQGFAGLLTDFTVKDIPKSLDEWLDDVDGYGTTLSSFLNDIDERVLRDGLVGVLCDFPNTLVASAADEIGLTRRPYFRAIDRRNIVNTRKAFINGRSVLTLIVIREIELVPDRAFGEKQRLRYRAIREDGSYIVYEADTNDMVWATTEAQFKVVDQGRYSIGRIPVVFYSLGNGAPPLMELAKTNLAYNRIVNEYLEILRRCNMPVPVRKGVADKSAPLLLGGHVVDIATDGDFYFAEITGNAITATRMELERFEQKMLQMALGFALTGGNNAKTATEIEMMATSTKASLKTLATRKQSAVEQMFSLWSIWMGGSEYGGSIDLNKNLLNPPLDPVLVDKLIQMVDGFLITKETALGVLQNGGILPRDLDIEAEVKKVSSAAAPKVKTVKPKRNTVEEIKDAVES